MKNIKFIFYLALLIILLCKNELIAKEKHNAQKIPVVFTANVDISASLGEITESKIDAALSLVSHGSELFRYIPNYIRDSIALDLKSKNIEPTAINIAKILNAKYILFTRINKIGNMMRSDIKAISTDSSHKALSGIGYALLRFISKEKSTYMYDPTLLKSLLRAISVLNTDSTKFTSDNTYNPVPTLVIGGFDFINDNNLSNWELFKNKDINSYDAVETIFDTCKNLTKYETYDTESLDSIFALHNIYGIEYYNSINSIEIKILYDMDVDYFIGGKFTRISSGTQLELSLYKVEKTMFRKLKSEKGLILHDDIEETRKVLKKLTYELLSDSNKNSVTKKMKRK